MKRIDFVPWLTSNDRIYYNRLIVGFVLYVSGGQVPERIKARERAIHKCGGRVSYGSSSFE